MVTWPSTSIYISWIHALSANCLLHLAAVSVAIARLVSTADEAVSKSKFTVLRSPRIDEKFEKTV